MSVPDQHERRRALDTTHSFIVQAPAGSGKTSLLTQRFLALLAHVDHAPEAILAITFTRKAAAEMRARILSALASAQLAPPEDPFARETWQLAKAALEQSARAGWDLLDNPNRLRIMTIDAFCLRITQQMPVLSQFGPPPAITDDPRSLYREAAQATLAELHNPSPWQTALRTVLLHLDNHLPRLERLLIDLLARRDQWLAYLVTPHDVTAVRTLLESHLQTLHDDHFNPLRALLPEAILIELRELVDFARTHSDSLPTDFWQAAGILLFTKEGQWRAQISKRIGFPATTSATNPHQKRSFAEQKKRLSDLIAHLQTIPNVHDHFIAYLRIPKPPYEEHQWNVLSALITLLPMAAATLQLSFRAHRQVDFTEISQSALLALGEFDNPSDLALALDYQLQHILVDEFQDTSVTQFRLLEKLTAGWQPQDGKTLFLVGDPMQSIYRFRQAEVGLFLKAQQYGVGALTLTPLTLRVNFRSARPIVSWFNDTFTQAFPTQPEIRTGAIPFTPSMASDPREDAAGVHYHCYDNTLDEAQGLVDLIRAHQANYPTEHIAILVKSRSHLVDLLPALQTAGIPYDGVELEKLHTHVTVHDLLSLTKALSHPADRLAWLAILRAPWCGLTLQDLTLLAGSEQDTLWERITSQTVCRQLSEDAQQRLAVFRAIMSQSLQNRARWSLREWVELTWMQLDGPACLTDHTELAYAEAFFALLSRCETASRAETIEKILHALENEYAQTRPHPHCPVQIMTIHKAKGLEFDTVILPSLHRRPPVADSPLLLWMEYPTRNNAVDLLLAPIKSTQYPNDPLYDFLRREEALKQTYETTRLLYVAATRAKRGLHLSAALPHDDARPPSPHTQSLLATLWPVVSERFLQTRADNKASPLTVDVFDRRLTRLATLPNAPAPLEPLPLNPISNHLDFDQEATRITGIYLHRVLAHLAQCDLDHVDSEHFLQQHEQRRQALQRLGIVSSALGKAAERVERAIANTLADPRGRWILSPHQDAHVEYALTTRTRDQLTHHVIDRTFIDETHTRWIIDFKFPDHGTENCDRFLAQAVETYRPQLQRYVDAFARRETHTLRAGLYFPLLKAWREIDCEVVQEERELTL